MDDTVLTQEKRLEELLKLDYRYQNLVLLTQELINLPNDTANLEVKKQLANHLVGLLRQNPFTRELKINSQSLTNPKEATELLNDIDNAFTLTVAPEENTPQPEAPVAQNAPPPGQTKTSPSPSSDRVSLLNQLFEQRWKFIRQEAPKNKARLDALAKAEEILGKNFGQHRQTILNEINFYLTQSPIDPKFIPGIIEGIALKLNPKPAAAANLRQALIPTAEAASSTTPFPNLDQIVSGLITDHAGDPATLQAELTRVALPPSIQIALTQLQSSNPQDRDQGRQTLDQIGRANPQFAHIVDQVTTTPPENFTPKVADDFAQRILGQTNPSLNETISGLANLPPTQYSATLQNLPNQLHLDTTSIITSELTLRQIPLVRAQNIAHQITTALHIVTTTQPHDDPLSASRELFNSSSFNLKPEESQILTSIQNTITLLTPTQPLTTIIQTLPPEILGNQTLIINFRDFLHTQIGIPQDITNSLKPQQVFELSLHHFALSEATPKSRLQTFLFLAKNKDLSLNQLLHAWFVNANQTTSASGKSSLPPTLTQLLKNPTRVHQLLGQLGLKLPVNVEKAIKFTNFIQNPFGALKSFLGSGLKSGFSNLGTAFKAGGKQFLSTLANWGKAFLQKAVVFLRSAFKAVIAGAKAFASAAGKVIIPIIQGLIASGPPGWIIAGVVVLAIVIVLLVGLLQTGPEQAAQLYSTGTGPVGYTPDYKICQLGDQDCPATFCDPNDSNQQCDWPVQCGCVTQGPETTSYPNTSHDGYNAIDIGVNGCQDLVVRATHDGKVIELHGGEAYGQGSGYGNYVKIAAPNGTWTLYGHLLTINVALYEDVKKGQPIGIADHTGNSTGPHLHYEYGGSGNVPSINSIIPQPVPVGCENESQCGNVCI